MNHEKSLFLNYLDGKAGLEEKRQLLALLKENPEAREELKSVYKEWAEQKGAAFDPWSSMDLVLSKVGRRRRNFLFPALAMAAAAAVAAILILSPFHKKQASEISVSKAELYTYPESESPMVLLSDGQVLHSDALEMQVSCTSSGIMIDGQEYTVPVTAPASCMLEVPYGHRARVQFADGSVVRLNSHSRIVFPTRFGKERNVQMRGEALFDVSRDEGSPFVVEFDDVKVQVLGTRFLVSGYGNEAHSVALISGSVNVSLGEGLLQSVTLAPNQMYTLDDNGKINVEDVTDWSGMLDWTEGVYRADGTSMKELLSYLSRYYGEKVECDSHVADIACTGTLYLKPTLSDMLSDLSRIFPIKSLRQDDVWLVSRSSN